MVNGDVIYKYMEFIIISLYLIIIFLSTQLWLIWKDLDKNKLRSKLLSDVSIFRYDILIVFSIGVVLMLNELVKWTNLQNSYLYIEFFELLGFICVSLFVYRWHSALKTCVHKKPPYENLLEACIIHKVKVEPDPLFCRMTVTSKLILAGVFVFTGSVLALYVPISTIFFALVIGLLFIPPALALASTIIGAGIISRESCPRQT